MNSQALKLLVFGILFTTIVLPLYLTCKFAIEWVWLYVPILSFWTFVHFSEEENKTMEEDQNV